MELNLCIDYSHSQTPAVKNYYKLAASRFIVYSFRLKVCLVKWPAPSKFNNGFVFSVFHNFRVLYIFLFIHTIKVVKLPGFLFFGVKVILFINVLVTTSDPSKNTLNPSNTLGNNLDKQLLIFSVNMSLIRTKR